MGELTSMPAFAGHYTFLKSQEPFTYYEEDYKGVPLSYLIEEKLSLSAGASGVKVIARDGYKVTLSLAQARKTYPGGLQAIIAYEKSGASLAGDEGPLRLIVPQSQPGSKDQGGDANTPLCARMIYAVEVHPLPARVSVPPHAGEVPGGLAGGLRGGERARPAAQPAPTPVTPQPASRSIQARNQQHTQTQQDLRRRPRHDAALTLSGNAAGRSARTGWFVAAVQVQPLKAILPLLYFFLREGG